MGSGTKKKGQIEMGDYIQNKYEQDAMIWCVKNNIQISPFAKSTSEWYLDITLSGKMTRSPESYDKKTLWKQMFKYYIYYYEKYNKNK